MSKVEVGELSPNINKNLIDNWYFIDPINQRGKEKYSMPSDRYSIDRWRLMSNSAQVELVENGIKFSSINTASSSCNFAQLFDVDSINFFRNKTFTLSVLISELNLVDGEFKLYARPGDTFPIGTIIPNGNTNLIIDKPGLHSVQITFNGGEQFKSLHLGVAFQKETAEVRNNYAIIQAIKLELGTNQTLAKQNKKTGEWELLDSPPNKAEELKKCMRYQQVIKVGGIVYGFVTIANSIRLVVPLPETMRDKPTFSILDGTNLQLGGIRAANLSTILSNPTVTKTTLQDNFANVHPPQVSINFDLSENHGIDINTPVVAYRNGTKSFLLDANI